MKTTLRFDNEDDRISHWIMFSTMRDERACLTINVNGFDNGYEIVVWMSAAQLRTLCNDIVKESNKAKAESMEAVKC